MKKNYNNGFKRLHTFPPPEKVKLNEVLTFTLNPSDTPYINTKNNRKVLLESFFNDIIKGLGKLRYCDYKIYPEISSTGKWHFHGTITITDIMNFYLYDVPLMQALGAIEIDTIKDLDIWLAYCTKQAELMKAYLTPLKLKMEINKKSEYYTINPLQQMERDKDDSQIDDEYNRRNLTTNIDTYWNEEFQEWQPKDGIYIVK